MPPLVLPAVAVTAAIMVLIFVWRLAREGRRRYEYTKGVYRIWRKNQTNRRD